MLRFQLNYTTLQLPIYYNYYVIELQICIKPVIIYLKKLINIGHDKSLNVCNMCNIIYYDHFTLSMRVAYDRAKYIIPTE